MWSPSCMCVTMSRVRCGVTCIGIDEDPVDGFESSSRGAVAMAASNHLSMVMLWPYQADNGERGKGLEGCRADPVAAGKVLKEDWRSWVRVAADMGDVMACG